MFKKLLALGLCLALLAPAAAQASTIRDLRVAYQNGSFALATPNFVLARALAANVAESITVPSNAAGVVAHYVSFSSTCDFYANYTTTATVPGDTTDGTASELNPLVRLIDPTTTTISVISGSACVITASFYM